MFRHKALSHCKIIRRKNRRHQFLILILCHIDIRYFIFQVSLFLYFISAVDHKTVYAAFLLISIVILQGMCRSVLERNFVF